MAPELLVGESRLAVATFDDLKRADIWALGMTLMVLLNPCCKYPYSEELQGATSKGQSKLQCLEVLLRRKQLPREPLKYQHKHATHWYAIQNISKACTTFEPKDRPSASEILAMINKDSSASSMDLHLKVSQGSAHIAQHHSQVTDIHRPDIDGTNACAFLSAQIAHDIHQLQAEGRGGKGSVRLDITKVAEHAINALPHAIKRHRNMQQLYDVLSAYTLLRKTGCISIDYHLSEKFLTPDPVFSEKTRTDLLQALEAMLLKEFSIALYTCEPIIFTIGCINDIIFNLDTHSIPEAIGGQGKELLKVFPYVEDGSLCFLTRDYGLSIPYTKAFVYCTFTPDLILIYAFPLRYLIE